MVAVVVVVVVLVVAVVVVVVVVVVVEFENWIFSTGSCHEPVLMPQTPLVPVGGSNQD